MKKKEENVMALPMRKKQEENVLEEFFAFCDANFSPSTKEHCRKLIEDVRKEANESCS